MRFVRIGRQCVRLALGELIGSQPPMVMYVGEIAEPKIRPTFRQASESSGRPDSMAPNVETVRLIRDHHGWLQLAS